MKNNTEIELKLIVSEENLQKLLHLEIFKQALRDGSKKVLNLSSSYYDTADMAFHRRGIAYRVRDKGDGSFEATVKTARKETGGLSERVEINIPLSEDRAVLHGFKELGLDCDLAELAPQGVQKLFTVKVQRTVYLLDVEGAVLEMAVDKGEILGGGRADKIDEIELELKEGEVAALMRFAKQLGREITLVEEKRSKYARGMVLLRAQA